MIRFENERCVNRLISLKCYCDVCSFIMSLYVSSKGNHSWYFLDFGCALLHSPFTGLGLLPVSLPTFSHPLISSSPLQLRWVKRFKLTKNYSLSCGFTVFYRLREACTVNTHHTSASKSTL